MEDNEFKTKLITLKPSKWFRDQLAEAQKATNKREERTATEIIMNATIKVEKFKEPKKPKLAFVCDYCAMTSNFKSNVKKHEKESCRKNPNRKTCRNCNNLDYDEDDGYFCDEVEGLINHSINIEMDCKYFDSK